MDKELGCRVIQVCNELNVPLVPHWDDLEMVAKRLGARLRSGCTRWALIFEKQRIVVKFPKYDETDNDYCCTEMENYQQAKEYRIERCLLPIEQVGVTENGLPMYIQPMYTTSHSGLDSKMRERWSRRTENLHYKDIVHKVEEGCLYTPARLWVERAIQIYGKAFMRSFQRWTKECRVNDLHAENIGYLGKQPIIIDYAGYHD